MENTFTLEELILIKQQLSYSVTFYLHDSSYDVSHLNDSYINIIKLVTKIDLLIESHKKPCNND